jgi:hypothetical protein
VTAAPAAHALLARVHYSVDSANTARQADVAPVLGRVAAPPGSKLQARALLYAGKAITNESRVGGPHARTARQAGTRIQTATPARAAPCAPPASTGSIARTAFGQTASTTAASAPRASSIGATAPTVNHAQVARPRFRPAALIPLTATHRARV